MSHRPPTITDNDRAPTVSANRLAPGPLYPPLFADVFLTGRTGQYVIAVSKRDGAGEVINTQVGQFELFTGVLVV